MTQSGETAAYGRRCAFSAIAVSPPFMRRFLVVSAPLFAAGLVAACTFDTAPAPVLGAAHSDGPTIVFDLTRRPLPEIPLPNDVATFADPSSRTGVRINVSSIAPSGMEENARRQFDAVEGWGTFAPITVAFARDQKTGGAEPAIDLADLAKRMHSDGYDFRDDPVYVVDLATGVPVPLDLGSGIFPSSVAKTDAYFTNDTKSKEDTFLFETEEEGKGLTQADYRPALDRDQDGILDHPNTQSGERPRPGTYGADETMTWYERETDTLRLRPVVPLEGAHRYAVIVTDRLRGKAGPVNSPFPGVVHPTQAADASRVQKVLGDAARANYFGDLAGTGLKHVAFTWSFTTQPGTADLLALRDGIYGYGPFAHLKSEFPTTITPFQSAGTTADPATSFGTSDPRCIGKKDRPYVISVSSVIDFVRKAAGQFFGLEGQALEKVIAEINNIDYFVVGTFDAPYYFSDPKHEDVHEAFALDFKNGTGRVSKDRVPFLIAVPKKGAGGTDPSKPFDAVTWSHGTGVNKIEVLLRAGIYARRGIGMIGIDMAGHGLALNDTFKSVAQEYLGKECYAPFVDGLFAGRAEDLDGDGVADPGGYLWTAHIFHSRDNVRQSVLDQLMVVRVLRSFDGHIGTIDANGDGKKDPEGDFDGDGIPDIGGPTARIFTAGNSYGGVVAMVHGAVDAEVTAAAPISGGGGLADIATRSALIPDSVIQQTMGPILVGVPAATRRDGEKEERTRCTDGQTSIRFVLNKLTSTQEMEIACLSKAELPDLATIVLSNPRNGELRCARVADGGSFRVPIAADIDDPLVVKVFAGRDVVDSYATCGVVGAPTLLRTVDTFEQAISQSYPVADESVVCDAPNGCAQYKGRYYPVGDRLVSPQEGLGLGRQTPALRRLFDLTQIALDAADPVNFAKGYALHPFPRPDGSPGSARGFASFSTAGDFYVPMATNFAFARAAGAVPFLSPEAAALAPDWRDFAMTPSLSATLGARTADDVLVGTGTLAGLERLHLSSGGPRCVVNYTKSAVCTDSDARSSACNTAVFDVDYLSEGQDRWDAAHPSTPLRLVRLARPAASLEDVDSVWGPRLATRPFSSDVSGYKGDEGPILAVGNAYTQPGGEHVWLYGDPCRAFDAPTYYSNLLADFFVAGGTNIRYAAAPGTHRCLASESCSFFKP
jgi:hypothetical protein